jgi:hypothetical protein
MTTERKQTRKEQHAVLMERALRSQGTSRFPDPIDPGRYPERPGLEGPFRFRDGEILYYDPTEGSYYDADSDLYVTPNCEKTKRPETP